MFILGKQIYKTELSGHNPTPVADRTGIGASLVFAVAGLAPGSRSPGVFDEPVVVVVLRSIANNDNRMIDIISSTRTT